MKKLIEAEIMSAGHTKLKVELVSGETIVGYSLGIMPLTDAYGEELEEEAMHFEAVEPDAYYRIKDQDIVKVEKAS